MQSGGSLVFVVSTVNGQADSKASTNPDLGLESDVSCMLVDHDRTRECEALTGAPASFFSGEKGFENPPLYIF